jgi:hypothetical protein
MKRFLVLLLLGAGCADEQPTVMTWSLSGTTCADAKVGTVHVFLGPLGDGAYDRDIRCELGEGDGAFLPGLKPGRYVLVLKGFGEERLKFRLMTEIDVDESGRLGPLVLEPYTAP